MTAAALAMIARTAPTVVIAWGIVGPIAARRAAMIIARRIVRAVTAAAVVVAWLRLTRRHPTHCHEANARSEKGCEAHHGLPSSQCALCFVVHRTPACTNR